MSSGGTPDATMPRTASTISWPAAVVEGERQDEAVVVAVVRSMAAITALPEIGRQAVEAADMAELRALAIEFGRFALDRLAQDAHDALRFPRPGRASSRSKRPRGSDIDAELGGGLGDAADVFGAPLVPGHARQPASGAPSGRCRP